MNGVFQAIAYSIANARTVSLVFMRYVYDILVNVYKN